MEIPRRVPGKRKLNPPVKRVAPVRSPFDDGEADFNDAFHAAPNDCPDFLSKKIKIEPGLEDGQAEIFTQVGGESMHPEPSNRDDAEMLSLFGREINQESSNMVKYEVDNLQILNTDAQSHHISSLEERGYAVRTEPERLLGNRDSETCDHNVKTEVFVEQDGAISNSNGRDRSVAQTSERLSGMSEEACGDEESLKQNIDGISKNSLGMESEVSSDLKNNKDKNCDKSDFNKIEYCKDISDSSLNSCDTNRDDKSEYCNNGSSLTVNPEASVLSQGNGSVTPNIGAFKSMEEFNSYVDKLQQDMIDQGLVKQEVTEDSHEKQGESVVSYPFTSSTSALIASAVSPTKGKPFSCPHCTYSCKAAGRMEKHLKTHKKKREETKYFCPVCDFTTIRKGSLRRHRLTHEDYKPWQCPHCEFKTKREENLKVHLLRHDKNAPKVKCDHCDFSALERGTILRHIRLVHEGDRPFSCSICGYAFKQGHDLRKHMMTHTGEKPFKCDQCDYRCAKSSGLKSHKMTHVSKKPHQCHLCEYSSLSPASLQRHIEKHSEPDEYICEWCDYKCIKRGSFAKHMRLKHPTKENIEYVPFKINKPRPKKKDKITTNGESADGSNSDELGVSGERESAGKDDLSCQHCTYTCDNEAVLKAHTIGHAKALGLDPEKCPECPYRSKLLGVLKRHFLHVHHPDSRSYVCATCGYTTHTEDNLRRHINVRHELRPGKIHACPECNYTCRYKHSLKEHMYRHTDTIPFQCKECDFKCYKLANLTRHETTVHSNAKPFECEADEHCKYTCKTIAQMRLHLRQLHSGEDPPFRCGLCAYATFRSSNLRRHMEHHS